MPNYSPIQLRFKEDKTVDKEMCARYEQAGNRAGTARSDVLVGHALALASPQLHQMILAMAGANPRGAITTENLIK